MVTFSGIPEELLGSNYALYSATSMIFSNCITYLSDNPIELFFMNTPVRVYKGLLTGKRGLKIRKHKLIERIVALA